MIIIIRTMALATQERSTHFVRQCIGGRSSFLYMQFVMMQLKLLFVS